MIGLADSGGVESKARQCSGIRASGLGGFVRAALIMKMPFPLEFDRQQQLVKRLILLWSLTLAGYQMWPSLPLRALLLEGSSPDPTTSQSQMSCSQYYGQYGHTA